MGVLIYDQGDAGFEVQRIGQIVQTRQFPKRLAWRGHANGRASRHRNDTWRFAACRQLAGSRRLGGGTLACNLVFFFSGLFARRSLCARRGKQYTHQHYSAKLEQGAWGHLGLV